MLNKYEEYLEETIKVFSPSFYWGKRWASYGGTGIQPNVVVGYVMSKTWFERVFLRRKLKRECVLLEMALYYWLSTKYEVSLDFVKDIPRWAKFNPDKMYTLFLSEVVNIGESNHGIFKDLYTWEIYLALVCNGFVKKGIALRYHNLRW